MLPDPLAERNNVRYQATEYLEDLLKHSFMKTFGSFWFEVEGAFGNAYLPFVNADLPFDVGDIDLLSGHT